MRINTNISAMNTYSRLTSANTAKSGSLAKLSSGLRINKAGDDAAGLAISEKMKNQVSGLTQASRNAQDGISLIQTAEGALSETHSILNRMRDLTVQAANGTNTADDKAAIQSEINSLTEEVHRIATTTTFNTQSLLQKGGTTVDVTKLDETKAKGLLKAYDEVKELEDETTYTTEADVAGKLNDLSEAELDEVINKYNENSKNLLNDHKTSASGFNTTMTNTDFDKIGTHYGVTAGAANPTQSEIDALKVAIQAEVDNVVDLTKTEIATANSTDGTKFSFQIGANASEKIDLTIGNMTAAGLGIGDVDGKSTLDITSFENTDDVLKTIDRAIKTVSEERANLGAVQNRLDHTVSNLATTKENLSEANSRITDVDMAEEMMSFTKSNILSQAATSMLAQANQMPQGVLQLLQ